MVIQYFILPGTAKSAQSHYCTNQYLVKLEKNRSQPQTTFKGNMESIGEEIPDQDFNFQIFDSKRFVKCSFNIFLPPLGRFLYQCFTFLTNFKTTTLFFSYRYRYIKEISIYIFTQI